jgi:hypothetical protein
VGRKWRKVRNKGKKGRIFEEKRVKEKVPVNEVCEMHCG